MATSEVTGVTPPRAIQNAPPARTKSANAEWATSPTVESVCASSSEIRRSRNDLSKNTSPSELAPRPIAVAKENNTKNMCSYAIRKCGKSGPTLVSVAAKMSVEMPADARHHVHHSPSANACTPARYAEKRKARADSVS